jgi:hypothetical protein
MSSMGPLFLVGRILLTHMRKDLIPRLVTGAGSSSGEATDDNASDVTGVTGM